MMSEARPTTKAAQRAETTARLLAIARVQFAEHGYAQAATESIVRLAGVTRGALYHYFDSKEGLFRAVVAAVQHDVARKVAAAAADCDDPWEQLRAGCRAFLRACLEPDVQRILLLDGPAVLGWEAWRALDAEHAMRLLAAGIDELVAQGRIQSISAPAVTHLLSGAMNEAVLWAARAAEPQQALDEAIVALDHLLAGLKMPIVA